MSHYVTTLRDLRLTIVFCSNFISVDFSYTLLSIPFWIITCKRMWCNVNEKTDISDRYVFLSTWTTLTSLNVAFLWTWRHRCHFAQNIFNQFSANRLSVLNYTSVNRAHVYPKPIPEPLRLYICITGFLLFFFPLDLLLNYMNWFSKYFSFEPYFVSISFCAYTTFQDVQLKKYKFPKLKWNFLYFFYSFLFNVLSAYWVWFL